MYSRSLELRHPTPHPQHSPPQRTLGSSESSASVGHSSRAGRTSKAVGSRARPMSLQRCPQQPQVQKQGKGTQRSLSNFGFRRPVHPVPPLPTGLAPGWPAGALQLPLVGYLLCPPTFLWATTLCWPRPWASDESLGTSLPSASAAPSPTPGLQLPLSLQLATVQI